MTQEHPITPSQEVVHQWAGYTKGYNIPGSVIKHIATQAARWGADQELEACCEWLEQNCGRWELPAALRAVRRPKPPSLKKYAFALLDSIETSDDACNSWDFTTIRRALESLPDQ